MNEDDMNRDELVAEARNAIENAKRKHQRWYIWQRIVDDFESGMPGDYSEGFVEGVKVGARGDHSW